MKHATCIGHYRVAPSFARCSGPRCRVSLAGLRAWVIRELGQRRCEYVCVPCMRTEDFSTTGAAS